MHNLLDEAEKNGNDDTRFEGLTKYYKKNRDGKQESHGERGKEERGDLGKRTFCQGGYKSVLEGELTYLSRAMLTSHLIRYLGFGALLRSSDKIQKKKKIPITPYLFFFFFASHHRRQSS
jgi:hypothetical protein